MECYKLVKLRKDGTIGSLFIGASRKYQLGEWYEAEELPKKGFSPRKGWHGFLSKESHHLTEKGRTWALCEVEDFVIMERPSSQGGNWVLANKIQFCKILEGEE